MLPYNTPDFEGKTHEIFSHYDFFALLDVIFGNK
jgi:hypothetical protein